MSNAFADIAYTPAVLRAQKLAGNCVGCREPGSGPAVNERLGEDEAAFIASQRSFYMATVSETSWPYVQHRGGPPGFLKTLDDKTLAFADFAGNRQLISVGNVSENNRVALILVDYATRLRLKVLGTMTVRSLGSGEKLSQPLLAPGYRARVQREVIIAVAAFDWNCPQHIPVRYEAEDVRREILARDARIAELERQLAARG